MIPKVSQRRLVFLLGDCFLISAAMASAVYVRFEGAVPDYERTVLWFYVLVALIVRIPVFAAYGLYSMSWSQVSVGDLIRVVIATGFGSAVIGSVFLALRGRGFAAAFPTSVVILDFFMALVLVGGFRSIRRVLKGAHRARQGLGRRVLIVGAGSAGEMILRAMQEENPPTYQPIAFVDDDPGKQGVAIRGVRVAGTRKELPALVRSLRASELLIAIPSAPSETVRETVALGRRAGLKDIRILPSLVTSVSRGVGLWAVREIELADLLGRPKVTIDSARVDSVLRGRRVLVTGAAGSIGSELCRQILAFEPALLLALDQAESGLFELEADLRRHVPTAPLALVSADVTDRRKLERVFQEHAPEVVFHAAAYKHVPLMEAHPDEAVKNNVLGTHAVAELAAQAGVERFVLISTDKAVNPSSVMGATKRLAEKVVLSIGAASRTRFMSVRFGNVLGSRGSVIPTFEEQIRRGGPVTLTHEDMTRYFMLVSEAVLLVLQAGTMGEGGEVFVLDMGEPVKIMDLAREVIRQAGYEPDRDIPIVVTGTRPGEKLAEELLRPEEREHTTLHQKIFRARAGDAIPSELLQEIIGRLKTALVSGSAEDLRAELNSAVPEFGKKSSPVI
ncbi:MAG TPA: nucleoside-diphosphate sugar epimerase/dehydratase [Planctomycetota bacterium]|nr:nucleoside-diphosphate sugar epimerase/dehydratase [Planctomycetota bacterium]